MNIKFKIYDEYQEQDANIYLALKSDSPDNTRVVMVDKDGHELIQGTLVIIYNNGTITPCTNITSKCPLPLTPQSSLKVNDPSIPRKLKASEVNIPGAYWTSLRNTPESQWYLVQVVTEQGQLVEYEADPYGDGPCKLEGYYYGPLIRPLSNE